MGPLLALIAATPAGCASRSRGPLAPVRPEGLSTQIIELHGKPLDLHLSRPSVPAAADTVVLYASGDGGWFGAAVDMFHTIGQAGYYAVGFSSRAFLRIQRPRGALDARQLADEYEQILAEARRALHLDPSTRAILTGWSRGAAFAVIVGSEPIERHELRGIVAIGLSEGEDLQVSGSDDDGDDGSATPGRVRGGPFEPYARIGRMGDLPCAVIQATRDNYLPAATARAMFGQDTPVRRFYAVTARNHRFSGGQEIFDRALLAAIDWIVSTSRTEPER